MLIFIDQLRSGPHELIEDQDFQDLWQSKQPSLSGPTIISSECSLTENVRSGNPAIAIAVC